MMRGLVILIPLQFYTAFAICKLFLHYELGYIAWHSYICHNGEVNNYKGIVWL